MKKVSILFASLAIAVVSFAQEGKFGVEINLNNPFTNTSFFSTNGLSVRYFLSDDIVVRGSLDISGMTTTTKTYSGDDLTSTTKSNTANPFMFSLTPGIEYHLAKFTKGSVYAGGELGLSLTSQTTSISPEDSSIPNSKSKNGGWGLGVGAFTGVDYYLTNNLYLGAELNMYCALLSTSRGSVTTGDNTTKGPTSALSSTIGINVNPALRLGWRF